MRIQYGHISFSSKEVHTSRSAPFQGTRERPCKVTAVSPPSSQERQSVQTESRTPVQILVKDCRFLQEHTGIDLITTFSPFRDVHDQVVAVLNPLAKEKIAEDLQEEISKLRMSLEQAHEEVHDLEEQLESTIDYLSGLEHNANSFQASLQANMQQIDIGADEVSQQRKESSSTASTSQAIGSKKGGLHSSLVIPDALRDFWYPVEFSSKLKVGKSKPFSLFSEQWQLMRTAQGAAICLPDIYSQQQSSASGSFPKRSALRVSESEGFVCVWTGEGEPPAPPDHGILPPDGFTIHSELELEVPVEHGLLLENLLDLAHAPFTHTSTFAKGWPIPDVVRFNAAKLLGGNWEPYPIDMSFEPPCMVLSTIGLAQPGKIERGLRAEACKKHLHQLHVCLPVGEGRTRLLYRMSMDFLSWTRAIPSIERFWASIANQVMGEDLVLVKGQQERMLAGADVWSHPVSYDKLGVRYRRWRNSLESGSCALQQAARDDLLPMAAGQIFSLEAEI